MPAFSPREPLLAQLKKRGFEFDQKLNRALEISASKPDISPEDRGFPDSYLTLALYRLNTILTRVVQLDQNKFNLFHEYKLAPPCKPEQVYPGAKLCRVLDRAVQLAQPRQTIGVGHFLRAVVSLSLDDEPMPADGFENQVIHNTFSIETLLWGLGHTAWTPIPSVPELRSILEILGGREPIEDIDYILTSEENRLVFRPTSVLDAYRMDSGGGKTSTRVALLTHFRDQYAGVTASEILELEDLINNRYVREEDLQRFFELHPHLLRFFDYRQIHPQVYLTREDEGPLIPDFILVDPELQKAMILDLKLPNAKLVVDKPNRRRFSSAVEEARAQLLTYRDWFENATNRSQLRERFGMDIYRPRLGVIIGSSQELQAGNVRQELASRSPDIEVVTYDDVLRHAERRLLLVKSAFR